MQRSASWLFNVELPGHDLLQCLFQSTHGMADPDDLALLHQKRRRDAVLSGRFHPIISHERVFSVHCDVVIHFVAHLLHELGDGGVFVLASFEDVHADERHLGEFVRHLGQVRNAHPAGAAPRRPKLHDVGLVGIQFGDGIALDPLGGFKLGRRIADG